MAPTPAANSRMSSRGGTERGDSQPQSMQHLLNDSSDLAAALIEAMETSHRRKRVNKCRQGCGHWARMMATTSDDHRLADTLVSAPGSAGKGAVTPPHHTPPLLLHSRTPRASTYPTPAMRHDSTRTTLATHRDSTYSASSMRLLFFSSSVASPPSHTLPAMMAPVLRPSSRWPAQAPPKARQM